MNGIVDWNGEKLRSDLKAVGQTYLINCCILLLLIAFVFIFYGPEKMMSILIEYKKSQPAYFGPLIPYAFNMFLIYSVLVPAIIEEVFFRGPAWFFVYYDIKFKAFPKLTWLFILIICGYLNLIWSGSHTFTLPVFLIGIPAYILVIRTKNIFAPILCHIMSNLSLYILAHILLHFKVL